MNNKQDWLSSKIDTHASSIEGRGMFANADIKQGEKLIVWGGDFTDRIGAEEARAKGFLVMQWDDNLYSFENKGDDDGYFINHSCDPNMWMLDAYILAAKRNIRQDEELTVDYVLWEADESYVAKWKCKCGSPICRGRITGKDWEKHELQDRYKNHFSPLLNKRIQRLNDNK